MKKFWIIVLIIILSMLVCSFTQILIYSMRGEFKYSEGTFSMIERSEDYKIGEEELSIENIQDINLSFASSDVNLIFSDREDLKVVEYSNKKNKDNKKFYINKTDSVVSIGEEREFVIFGFISQKLFDIYIPKSYANNLKLESGSSYIENSGDMILKNVEMTLASGDINFKDSIKIENLKISTASGNIDINKLESKKTIINTASGDICINEELKADEAQLKTISGEIETNDINSEKINVESTSGDVQLRNIYGSINVKTVSGEIELEEVIGSLEGKTTSGDLSVNKFLINENSDLLSVSGDIKIYLDKTSNCNINTKTVSGDVDLPNGRNVVGVEPYNILNISTTSGDIMIENI